MPHPPFVTGEYYHVYNRGVEKRPIFTSHEDYFRFIFGLYEFNDENQVIMRVRRRARRKVTEMASRTVARIPLVEILCFCLMPNHYHLLVKQVKDHWLTLFLRKLGIGYTLFFNLTHGRSGYLFQGNAKAKHVATDAYLLHLSRYIHVNPLELVAVPPGTAEPALRAAKLDALPTYRWSSYLDYIGSKNFPSVTSRVLIHEMVGGLEKYQQFVRECLPEQHEQLRDVLFEGEEE